MALPSAEDGAFMAAATWAQLLPASMLGTSGERLPISTYLLPRSMNGMEPVVSYFVASASCAAVGCLMMSVFEEPNCSTGVKVTYLLVYVEPTNVYEGVFG